MKKCALYRCKQEFSEEFSTEYRYQRCDLEDLLDYIDTAPTIEVKDNG